MSKLAELSSDETCHGIMVELPLPKHMNKEKIMMAVDPEKDVDGLSPINRGRMFTKKEGLFPVTPQSCIEIMKRQGITLEGKNVCLVGRGDTVGSRSSSCCSTRTRRSPCATRVPGSEETHARRRHNCGCRRRRTLVQGYGESGYRSGRCRHQ